MAGSIRFLLALGAIGGEATGAVAHTLWHKFSTTGRRTEAYRRLQASGHIEISGSGPLDERIVRLTAQGSLACRANLDPERLWSRPWDGTWRIVAFDIPETDSKIRAQLRRKLHELRFGWLQNSVWISPDPTDDFRALLSEKRLLPESLTLQRGTSPPSTKGTSNTLRFCVYARTASRSPPLGSRGLRPNTAPGPISRNGIRSCPGSCFRGSIAAPPSGPPGRKPTPHFGTHFSDSRTPRPRPPAPEDANFRPTATRFCVLRGHDRRIFLVAGPAQFVIADANFCPTATDFCVFVGMASRASG